MASNSKPMTRIFSWILLGFLFLGLAGFGAANLGGSVQSIGAVGDRDIPVTTYARALQNELRATEAQFGQQLSMQQAQAFGITNRVLSRVVIETALDSEAERIALSVDDAAVAKDLNNIQAFKGPDGQFSRENYRFSLKNAGYSETEFEESVRTESARTILQAAIIAGNAMPSTAIDTLLDYVTETRNITLTTLTADDLTQTIADPDLAALETYYKDNIATYTLPERKQITYAILTPDMVLDQVDLSDDALRAAYDARRDEFNQPERRLVERLVFLDADQARAKLAEIDAGTTDFETVVADRGLALADIDIGDVTMSELGEASAGVFAANLDQVVGPFDTDLGPALFRVNGILVADVVTFDEARDQLFDELATESARRMIDAKSTEIDDAMAAGATLEDLEKEFGMRVDVVMYHDGTDAEVAGYPNFRAVASAVQDGDFPTVEPLNDGGIFSVRLDGIEPPAPMPLDEVMDQVSADWRTAQTRAALEAFANDAIASGAVAGSPTSLRDLKRTDVGAVATAEILAAAFELSVGDKTVLMQNDNAVIVQLDAINKGDRDSDDTKALRANIEQQFGASLADDLFNVFATQIQQSAGISLNQQAINAVHANFQ
jgi:peptidyl-prolyl cis-trans isomerase D